MMPGEDKDEPIMGFPGPVRCKRCNWPLAATRDQGCVDGDCSFRCNCSPGGHRKGCPLRTAKAEVAPEWLATTPAPAIILADGEGCVELLEWMQCHVMTQWELRHLDAYGRATIIDRAALVEWLSPVATHPPSCGRYACGLCKLRHSMPPSLRALLDGQRDPG